MAFSGIDQIGDLGFPTFGGRAERQNNSCQKERPWHEGSSRVSSRFRR
jgi:hypothetical protein